MTAPKRFDDYHTIHFKSRLEMLESSSGKGYLGKTWSVIRFLPRTPAASHPKQETGERCLVTIADNPMLASLDMVMKFKILHAVHRPLDELSVQKICRKAGISRKTFYRHFESRIRRHRYVDGTHAGQRGTFAG